MGMAKLGDSGHVVGSIPGMMYNVLEGAPAGAVFTSKSLVKAARLPASDGNHQMAAELLRKYSEAADNPQQVHAFDYNGRKDRYKSYVKRSRVNYLKPRAKAAPATADVKEKEPKAERKVRTRTTGQAESPRPDPVDLVFDLAVWMDTVTRKAHAYDDLVTDYKKLQDTNVALARICTRRNEELLETRKEIARLKGEEVH